VEFDRRHYVFAIAATGLAVLGTLVVTRWLEDFPLLILLTAVMVSSLHGGAGPGLVATALSGLAILGATHFLATDFQIPRVNLGDEVVRLIIFLFVASGISTLAGARRRAERERDSLLVREQAARERAEEASWAKDRFLATVSHELRNPLAAILSWASLLRRGAVDGQRARRGLEAIERSAKMQARLIDDLLDVSRIVAGKLKLDVRSTDLVPVIASALDTVRPAAEAKHLQLDVALDPATGLVKGDPDRLQQIMWNLLSNSIKFTPDGGSVWVNLERFNRQAELRVSDTGQGIAPELLPHLFEPFWQAETNLNRRTAGLGLGLTIVRHLVELHGGTVVAHSKGAGKGALFRVTIPLIQPGGEIEREAARDRVAADIPAELTPSMLRGVPVLVVDDVPTNEAVRTALAACGAEVRVADSTPAALQMLDHWQPAVLVAGIEMAGGDAYTLIRQLRQRQPERGGAIPAVALVDHERAEDCERVVDAGYQVHVARSADLAELVRIVASLTAAREASPTVH
jgi:signal transduction histidine kinase/CheY-like chemotaxis protein